MAKFPYEFASGPLYSFTSGDHRVVKKFKCEFRTSLVQLFGANYEIKKVHISHALISLGKIVAMQYSCTYVQIISYDLVTFGFFVVALNPFSVVTKLTALDQ